MSCPFDVDVDDLYFQLQKLFPSKDEVSWSMIENTQSIITIQKWFGISEDDLSLLRINKLKLSGRNDKKALLIASPLSVFESDLISSPTNQNRDLERHRNHLTEKFRISSDVADRLLREQQRRSNVEYKDFDNDLKFDFADKVSMLYSTLRLHSIEILSLLLQNALTPLITDQPVKRDGIASTLLKFMDSDKVEGKGLIYRLCKAAECLLASENELDAETKKLESKISDSKVNEIEAIFETMMLVLRWRKASNEQPCSMSDLLRLIFLLYSEKNKWVLVSSFNCKVQNMTYEFCINNDYYSGLMKYEVARVEKNSTKLTFTQGIEYVVSSSHHLHKITDTRPIIGYTVALIFMMAVNLDDLPAIEYGQFDPPCIHFLRKDGPNSLKNYMLILNELFVLRRTSDDLRSSIEWAWLSVIAKLYHPGSENWQRVLYEQCFLNVCKQQNPLPIQYWKSIFTTDAELYLRTAASLEVGAFSMISFVDSLICVFKTSEILTGRYVEFLRDLIGVVCAAIAGPDGSPTGAIIESALDCCEDYDWKFFYFGLSVETYNRIIGENKENGYFKGHENNVAVISERNLLLCGLIRCFINGVSHMIRFSKDFEAIKKSFRNMDRMISDLDLNVVQSNDCQLVVIETIARLMEQHLHCHEVFNIKHEMKNATFWKEVVQKYAVQCFHNICCQKLSVSSEELLNKMSECRLWISLVRSFIILFPAEDVMTLFMSVKKDFRSVSLLDGLLFIQEEFLRILKKPDSKSIKCNKFSVVFEMIQLVKACVMTRDSNVDWRALRTAWFNFFIKNIYEKHAMWDYDNFPFAQTVLSFRCVMLLQQVLEYKNGIKFDGWIGTCLLPVVAGAGCHLEHTVKRRSIPHGALDANRNALVEKLITASIKTLHKYMISYDSGYQALLAISEFDPMSVANGCYFPFGRHDGNGHDVDYIRNIIGISLFSCVIYGDDDLKSASLSLLSILHRLPRKYRIQLSFKFFNESDSTHIDVIQSLLRSDKKHLLNATLEFIVSLLPSQPNLNFICDMDDDDGYKKGDRFFKVILSSLSKLVTACNFNVITYGYVVRAVFFSRNILINKRDMKLEDQFPGVWNNITSEMTKMLEKGDERLKDIKNFDVNRIDDVARDEFITSILHVAMMEMCNRPKNAKNNDKELQDFINVLVMTDKSLLSRILSTCMLTLSDAMRACREYEKLYEKCLLEFSKSLPLPSMSVYQENDPSLSLNLCDLLLENCNELSVDYRQWEGRRGWLYDLAALERRLTHYLPQCGSVRDLHLFKLVSSLDVIRARSCSIISVIRTVFSFLTSMVNIPLINAPSVAESNLQVEFLSVLAERFHVKHTNEFYRNQTSVVLGMTWNTISQILNPLVHGSFLYEEERMLLVDAMEVMTAFITFAEKERVFESHLILQLFVNPDNSSSLRKTMVNPLLNILSIALNMTVRPCCGGVWRPPWAPLEGVLATPEARRVVVSDTIMEGISHETFVSSLYFDVYIANVVRNEGLSLSILKLLYPTFIFINSLTSSTINFLNKNFVQKNKAVIADVITLVQPLFLLSPLLGGLLGRLIDTTDIEDVTGCLHNAYDAFTRGVDDTEEMLGVWSKLPRQAALSAYPQYLWWCGFHHQVLRSCLLSFGLILDIGCLIDQGETKYLWTTMENGLLAKLVTQLNVSSLSFRPIHSETNVEMINSIERLSRLESENISLLNYRRKHVEIKPEEMVDFEATTICIPNAEENMVSLLNLLIRCANHPSLHRKMLSMELIPFLQHGNSIMHMISAARQRYRLTLRSGLVHNESHKVWCSVVMLVTSLVFHGGVHDDVVLPVVAFINVHSSLLSKAFSISTSLEWIGINYQHHSTMGHSHVNGGGWGCGLRAAGFFPDESALPLRLAYCIPLVELEECSVVLSFIYQMSRHYELWKLHSKHSAKHFVINCRRLHHAYLSAIEVAKTKIVLLESHRISAPSFGFEDVGISHTTRGNGNAPSRLADPNLNHNSFLVTMGRRVLTGNEALEKRASNVYSRIHTQDILKPSASSMRQGIKSHALHALSLLVMFKVSLRDLEMNSLNKLDLAVEESITCSVHLLTTCVRQFASSPERMLYIIHGDEMLFDLCQGGKETSRSCNDSSCESILKFCANMRYNFDGQGENSFLQKDRLLQMIKNSLSLVLSVIICKSRELEIRGHSGVELTFENTSSGKEEIKAEGLSIERICNDFKEELKGLERFSSDPSSHTNDSPLRDRRMDESMMTSTRDENAVFSKVKEILNLWEAFLKKHP